MSRFDPDNVFVRDVTAAPLASDQTNARKIANQLNYQRPGYSYDGKPAPSFFGYTGTGYSKASGLAILNAKFTQFSPAIFYVPTTMARQKVTYVDKSGNPQPAGESSSLQSFLEAVPVPDVTKVPSGQLTAEGTDKHCTIICGKEMWEFFRLEGSPGSYICHSAGYVADITTFKGLLPNGWWSRATGLMQIGGLITLQDLIDVMRGGAIQHAIGIAAPITGEGVVAPGDRSDLEVGYYGFVPELHEGSANPAYPHADAVPEGSWWRFPPASSAGEQGLTGPLEKAIYEAIRRYGMALIDSGGPTGEAPVQFYVECPVSLGSPYASVLVNPIFKAPFNGGINYIPSSWRDPTLTTISEQIHNEEPNMFSRLPWKNLELLAPRSS